MNVGHAAPLSSPLESGFLFAGAKAHIGDSRQHFV
jgi:hypothetical protein